MEPQHILMVGGIAAVLGGGVAFGTRDSIIAFSALTGCSSMLAIAIHSMAMDKLAFSR